MVGSAMPRTKSSAAPTIKAAPRMELAPYLGLVAAQGEV